jgi:hypothetical protein
MVLRAVEKDFSAGHVGIYANFTRGHGTCFVVRSIKTTAVLAGGTYVQVICSHVAATCLISSIDGLRSSFLVVTSELQKTS